MTDGVFPERQYLEDFKVGDRFSYGAWEMTKDQMIAYAEIYDPEPFHLDEQAAIDLGWDGLIASGPQIVGLFRRLSKDAFPKSETVISPGWDEIRWLLPVFAGDVLTCHSEIVESRLLQSRPGEGLMKFFTEMKRQNGDVVSTVLANWFIRCRPDG